ncbi:response regulator [Microbacterium sp. G2-8]|uniref:response regulator n=1 Tax=Microbacterium sp. G2-8 TaxID=2842454 RepID=UPI001C8A7F0C|nr:response regulator [Microbacterium sp. G2-8]
MTADALRVLVVDDDRGARLLHGRYVDEAPGFALVGRVGTGLAAIEFAAHHDVDLVLLDMRLPDISGVEVLNRLRTHGLAHTDVLVISSSQDQVTVRQALAGRVIGYLVKPFTQERLHDRLAAYRADRAARNDERERDRPLAQGEIDRLLAPARAGGDVAPRTPAPASELPRGISEVTLRRVLAELDPIEPLTAAELAARSEISRATARRYLDHLVDAGRIDRAHRYGRRGRPEVLYRLAPGTAEA